MTFKYNTVKEHYTDTDTWKPPMYPRTTYVGHILWNSDIVSRSSNTHIFIVSSSRGDRWAVPSVSVGISVPYLYIKSYPFFRYLL